MRTYIIDVDGTVFRHGSEEWLPGSKERVAALVEEGHRLVFVTRRGHVEFGDSERYGRPAAERARRALVEVAPDALFLPNCPSPRILVDDTWVQVRRTVTDQGLATATVVYDGSIAVDG